MKDSFGNQKPVAIETDEWWFTGRIIQKQNDCRLPKWISFNDDEDDSMTEIHANKRDAISFVLKNPILNSKDLASGFRVVHVHASELKKVGQHCAWVPSFLWMTSSHPITGCLSPTDSGLRRNDASRRSGA